MGLHPDSCTCHITFFAGIKQTTLVLEVCPAAERVHVTNSYCSYAVANPHSPPQLLQGLQDSNTDRGGPVSAMVPMQSLPAVSMSVS